MTISKIIPVFAITMGDPAGVGPEIAIKATINLKSNDYTIVIIGDFNILQHVATVLGEVPKFNVIYAIDEAIPGFINVLDQGIITTDGYTTGKAQASCGKAAYAYIIKAIELAMSKKIDAVITNPINKEALKMAGINYPGHTEIFADKTGSTKYSMIFLLDNVGVAHVTTHCSVRKALDLITRERVSDHIRILNDAMKRLGIANPRLAAGGLNPHAGEHGLFGDEEIKEIEPAVIQARSEGINVQGPYPPDTVFMRAFKGEFDGVVAMLHDHGFVALKSRDFEHGVNITCGLPIIRTSVGHGTAFDLAGTGKASEKSLLSAIDAAWRIYRNKQG
jgi:4-phospho-D-threonate 3-dehydrogenase / 4-phospho-D-erythronate 3-dehydrogenase